MWLVYHWRLDSILFVLAAVAAISLWWVLLRSAPNRAVNRHSLFVLIFMTVLGIPVSEFVARAEAARLREMVQGLQVSFLQSWLLHGRSLEVQPGARPLARYFPALGQVGECCVKLTHSRPGGESQMGIMLLEGIRAAKVQLDVVFAYILVPEFVDALTAAARRGVRVRVLVPSKKGIDVPAAYHAFAQQYAGLLRTGNVELYEFNQYTHLKFMVADRRIVFTSTGNPEWDSWQRAFDEIVLIDDPQAAADLAQRVFGPDLAPERARCVLLEEVEATRLAERLRQRGARLLFDTFFRVTPGGVTLDRANHPHYAMAPKEALSELAAAPDAPAGSELG
ncbi:MAG: phosphatidylserine/phosphatidylglycerophosphate/cardiolipin synthase family protein [Deltaproteobacteria bacterium]|nr:MAG: phosphatidylserine/phosphatidylglycerophosphate/cardiolipin synthase family protein [Deltaproteobacteria bacterium]